VAVNDGKFRHSGFSPRHIYAGIHIQFVIPAKAGIFPRSMGFRLAPE
jgi:hypothetical protein